MFKRSKKQYRIAIIDFDGNYERIYFNYRGQNLVFDSFINLKKYLLTDGNYPNIKQ